MWVNHCILRIYSPFSVRRSSLVSLFSALVRPTFFGFCFEPLPIVRSVPRRPLFSLVFASFSYFFPRCFFLVLFWGFFVFPYMPPTPIFWPVSCAFLSFRISIFLTAFYISYTTAAHSPYRLSMLTGSITLTIFLPTVYVSSLNCLRAFLLSSPSFFSTVFVI